MNKYVIDANILISFHIFTPEHYHRNFWNELERQIAGGHIIILDEIANECKNQALKNWLTALKKQGLITAVNAEIRQLALQLNKKHKMITTDAAGRIKSQADIYLLAYAQKHNLSVFSYEGKRRNPQEPPKIPDVCTAEGIHYERIPSPVMRQLGFASCS